MKTKLSPEIRRGKIVWAWKPEKVKWYSIFLRRPITKYWNKVSCLIIGHGITVPIGPTKGSCSDCGRKPKNAKFMSDEEEAKFWEDIDSQRGT